MTATQLAQALMDLAAESGHDPEVVIGPEDACKVVKDAGLFHIHTHENNGSLKIFDEFDDPFLPSKEVVHVY